ncbi:hypothetical protein QYF61_026025 [Mycteria americana]|uniref:Uncharacterized protein n=1 Tax=Mycteria americana TaxID=33587 RepID=A0AAN7N011_MYCAM|nr:hypothetical protein QYF61_026025 [Mycteria americana]
MRCHRQCKRVGPVVVRPLSIVFESFKLMGEVPEDSRKQVSTLVKGKKEDPGNYRPVRLTLIPGKVEQIILAEETKTYNFILLTTGAEKRKCETEKGQRALYFLVPRCRNTQPTKTTHFFHYHLKTSKRPPHHLAKKAALWSFMEMTTVFIS